MEKLFCENLRDARHEAKMTQKQVAEAIGVAKSTYSLYESGKREPGIDGIKKLAKALNVSPDTLIGNDYQEFQLTAQDTALLVMFKDLNDVGRKKVMEYVSDLYDRYKTDVRSRT